MDVSLWISIPVGALTGIAIVAHYYYKNAFSYWEARGVKGPKAYPFFGNLFILLMRQRALLDWRQKFGKVYGIYDGKKPALVVTDPAVLRQICIKDFNKFPNHHDFGAVSELHNNFIFSTRDDQWRRIRALMSPTFTSGKMRRMFKLINVCTLDMVAAMRTRLVSSPVVHVKNLFNLYTMDAIASCCYAIRMSGYQHEKNLESIAKRDEFIRLAMKIFEFGIMRLLAFITLNGRLLNKLLDMGFFSGHTERPFAQRVEQIIKKRSESDKGFDDYLQTLVDAKLQQGSNKEEDHLDVMENHHVGEKADNLNLEDVKKEELKGLNGKVMSDVEILSNATLLLAVGLETTSTLLTNCFYTLSFHPEIQERLYQTVKSLAVLDEQGEITFDYDSLTSCSYLDAVISETLRLHSPVTIVDRQASCDYHLESHNINITKGTKIVLAIKAIMLDPEYWPQPDIFDPERFMPEQASKIVPNSYCPFGIGPRHCLGMRFSLTESKLALARLLLEFKFEPAPGVKYPPELKLQFGFTNIKRPEVNVVKR